MFKYNDLVKFGPGVTVWNEPDDVIPATDAATDEPDAQLVKSPFNGK